MKATILSLVVGLMLSVNAMARNANCPLGLLGKSGNRFDQSTNFAQVMKNQPQAQNVNALPSNDSRTQ